MQRLQASAEKARKELDALTASQAYELRLVDADGRVGIDYGVYGVPETFVIDRQGVIRASLALFAAQRIGQFAAQRPACGQPRGQRGHQHRQGLVDVFHLFCLN